MMKSNDELIPIRKAFSAEQSKDSNEFSSTSDLSNELGNRGNKACASASYLSARRKCIQERHLDSLLSDDFTSKYLKLNSKEDQKLFLGASQILEKLNKTISNFSKTNQNERNSEIPSSNTKKANFRELVLYQKVLKRLLEERCTLILKEECDICIKRTVKLTSDFKHLYMNEKLKMMTMPIQACNRFVSSNDISVSTLELLIKKLQLMCDLHSSISSSYQKIINCFHVGLDLELYQMVLKTNRILQEHKSNLFYWAYKSVTILMQKLCLADPNSISPDFLQSILESCEIFNVLLKNNKGLRYCFVKSCDLFYHYVKTFEYKELPLSLVLNYLAFFEAKIASEKVVHFLTSACKKYQQTSFKKKNLQNEAVQNIDSNTSDYCSASISDLDSEHSTIKAHQFTNISSNFAAVLVSITQRNQSLILKYMYAISNLQNSSNKTKRRASCENSFSFLSARQMWNVPEQNFKSSNYAILEETYWITFWNNVEMLILKILFDVPYHQYGDSVAGTLILWPDAFLYTLLECLKLSTINNDISEEGKYVMKQIHEYILAHRIYASWDKEFSSALSAIYSHNCSPVPLASNQIRTLPGNILYTCLNLLLSIFDSEFQDMDLLLFLKCLQQLHATLDCFILWVNNKSRSLIASQNLPTYLLISWSDCKGASQLLLNKTAILNEDANTFTRIPILKLQKEKVILQQINILKGFEIEAPSIIYKVCSSAMEESLLFTLKYEHSLKTCSIFGPKTFDLDTQEELIFPLTEVINRLSDTMPVLKAITTSVAQALLSVLRSLRKAIRVKHISLLSTELSKFIQWIDTLDLCEEEKNELIHLPCIQKVDSILKCIQNPVPLPRPFSKQRNRVMPLAETELQNRTTILNDEEKQYWQGMNSRNLFSCF
ncbi:uncharacterized protein TNCV_647551 [Trichonephila clavipes]|uniref:Coiled-coil protein 142 C-terminal domain-containing protein n=1 Tax=Trichonephila clavipes TaxID=2585209 RepID=A0A8X6SJU4_TRICX|nr:uncharacterized protein TNCV_647551 [Trichonephila clavipes]